MPTVTLIGGPCDQQTINITQAKLDSGQLTCQGTLYVRTSVFGSQENITFATSAAITKATKGPSPQHAMQAWSRWMHVLAHKGPQSHRRIVKSTARVRRIARKR